MESTQTQAPNQINMATNPKSRIIVPKGNLTFRHFKALSRKNAINWRRTWCGSILEILCPAFLMLVLSAARNLVKPTSAGNTDMYSLQKPIYPTTTLNSSGNWTTQPNAALGANLLNFLNFTSYPGLNTTNATNTSAYSQNYNPLYDLTGPLNFFPKHCVQTSGGAQYQSPIIGYVPTGNQIEKDVVTQLNITFAQQKLMSQIILNRASNVSLASVPAAFQQQVASQISAYKQFGNFTVQKFDSIADFQTYIGRTDYGTDEAPGVCFGFKITQNNAADYELELMFYDLWPGYARSLPSQKLPAADPSVQAPDTASYDLYIKEGYAYMQNWVANTILTKVTNNSNAQIVTMVVPMQSQQTTSDLFTTIAGTLFPLFMILMYVPLLYRMVYRIVNEKVTRAKESMRMMGLGDFAYWSSWLAYYTVVNTVLALVVWLILLINVFHRKSGFLLYVMLWLYGQSLFGLVLIIQSLFDSPRAAAITTTIVYFGTSLFSTLVSSDGTSREAKIAVYFFFPTVTMAQCFQPFIQFDASIGMNFQTWQYVSFGTTVLTGIVMQIIGGVVNFLLGLYLEQVLPKTYGERKHPLFFLGCKLRHKKAPNAQIQHDSIEKNEPNFETKYLNPDYCEAVGIEQIQKENSGQVLKISDLKKVYENGFKAVDGINLKLYSDQIFVLLGHNGAGKTSTISMLSGLFGSTDGMAELFGIDMFADMNKVREVMGVCPQYDVLFELLTTEEHLSFFYDLKGADPLLKKQEIEQLMKEVGVDDKRNALAYQLSGGNKRKLSVAIALCGGSKFVLLDEPTSGMDLSARRQLWNMLKAQKKDRIILLTTHYMDEADILGDRIAIMAKGKISCVGSSMFLKSKFGVGYNLTIVKSTTEKSDSILPYLQKQLGDKVIKQSEIQSEMTVQIPHEYDFKFGEFFQKFDLELEKLQIRSYGISISTLEEVFLKVGHLEDPVELRIQSPMLDKQADLEFQNTKNDDFNLKDNIKELDESFFNNLSAVIYRRFSNYRRNKKAIFNEAIIPGIIMVFGVTISQIATQTQSPSRIQDPSRFALPQTVTFNNASLFPTNGNVQNLVKNLPQLESAFDIQYINYTSSSSPFVNMSSFGQQVYNDGVYNHTTPPYVYGAYQIYQADYVSQQYKFVSFVNLTSQDVTGLYPLFMYQSILKTATNNPKFNFTVRSTPYPPTDFVKVRLATSSASTVAFIGGIAYAMMITAVVSYLVVERLEGLKHLQLISGMQLKAYWVGNFIFDFAKMYFTIIVTIILFLGYGLGFDGSVAVYLVFPFGILPFTYVSSFIFTADSAAQTFTMFLHFLIFSIASVLIFFIRFSPKLEMQGDGLDKIFRVVPTYMLGHTLFCDSSCQGLALTRQLRPSGTGKQLQGDKWDISNIPADIISLFIHFFLWTFILILIEKGYFSWCRLRPNGENSSSALKLDEDVLNEERRVQAGGTQDVITVQGFKKVYSQQSSMLCWDTIPVTAVNNLNFGLASGECFALLGVNGAGKSTTFKSLTHEVLPTSGSITVGGYNLSQDFEKARKLIGYCPQPNLVFDTMTVEEHIYFYAMIKGIPLKKRKTLVEQAIEQLGLQDHRYKPAGTLSGGNKRKVCVAQALVGNPPIILLDEPSAGMDPEARRFMWTVVARIAQRKTSAVILTTHSMDEAEALSTKMGIMIKGGIFQCFGSSQHIKTKFGTGFVVEIKIRTLEEQELQSFAAKIQLMSGQPDLSQYKFADQIKQVIVNQSANLPPNERIRRLHADLNLFSSIQELCGPFVQVDLLEKFGNYMKVRFAKQDQSIGKVFAVIESIKQRLEVSEYSVGQTTLEQIFQGFAEQHYVENLQKYGLDYSGPAPILSFFA